MFKLADIPLTDGDGSYATATIVLNHVLGWEPYYIENIGAGTKILFSAETVLLTTLDPKAFRDLFNRKMNEERGH